METPEFTVIIPTYNWSAVLPYSVGSVLRQTFADFELLVIGDGCTDDSESVAASFADPRVRWINLPKNTGHQVGPNNEGIKLARGKYIAYLGHDDLWMPGHLAALHKALDAGADFAYTGTLLVMREGDAPTAYCIRERGPNIWIPPTSFAHTKALADRIGGWRKLEELCSDPESDLLNRVQESGASIVFVPRMTAIKFPAAERKNVYKIKPCHEQKEWFDRIGANPDFEAETITEMITVQNYDTDHRPFRQLLGDWMDISRSRLAKRLSPAVKDASSYKSVVVAKRRSFKGLHPLD